METSYEDNNDDGDDELPIGTKKKKCTVYWSRHNKCCLMMAHIRPNHVAAASDVHSKDI
jgi:hypothetical protein